MELVDKIKNYWQERRLRREAERAEQTGEYYDALECYSELHDNPNIKRLYEKMKAESTITYERELALMLHDAGFPNDANDLAKGIDFKEWYLPFGRHCDVLEVYQKLGWKEQANALKKDMIDRGFLADIKHLRELGFTDKELEDIVNKANENASTLHELGSVGLAYLELGMKGKAREIADELFLAYDGDAAGKIYKKLNDKQKVEKCKEYSYIPQSNDAARVAGEAMMILGAGGIVASMLAGITDAYAYTAEFLLALSGAYLSGNKSKEACKAWNANLESEREKAEKRLFTTSA